MQLIFIRGSASTNMVLFVAARDYVGTAYTIIRIFIIRLRLGEGILRSLCPKRDKLQPVLTRRSLLKRRCMGLTGHLRAGSPSLRLVRRVGPVGPGLLFGLVRPMAALPTVIGNSTVRCTVIRCCYLSSVIQPSAYN